MSKRVGPRPRLVLALSFLLTSIAAVTDSPAGDGLDSLLYGVVSSTSGGAVHVREAGFELPAGHRLLDVKYSPNWIWLTVAFETDELGKYVSELWQIEFPRAVGTVDLDGKRVLASFELRGGEATKLCHSVVGCGLASALYVQHWEGGRTQVFGTDGSEVEINWPVWLPGHEQRQTFDCIRPLAWVGSHPSGFRLVCLAYVNGGEPYLALVDLATGAVELGPASDLFGEVGNDLLVSFSNNRW